MFAVLVKGFEKNRMDTYSQLKFHETFQPENGYIGNVIDLAAQNFSGTKYDISARTGIPTGAKKGKVEPHIKYAFYMGLINFSVDKGCYTLSLTDLGSEIYAQDKYLHEALTKWICHYNISKRIGGAPQWSFFVNDVHPGFIQTLSKEFLQSQVNKAFGPSVLYNDVIGIVKRSYSSGFFSVLKFIIDSPEGLQFTEKVPYDDLLYVYAFALLDNWESLIPDKLEISMIEIIEKLSFGKIFGFNMESVSEVLDEIADEGLIVVNRQLFPPTIIKVSTAHETINYLYSRML